MGVHTINEENEPFRVFMGNYVQFQDFSGPEIQYPWETCIYIDSHMWRLHIYVITLKIVICM